MIRLRNIDEWVGILVLLALAGFVAAVLQAGLLRDWFRPVSTLRILLPEAGTGGLAAGADVQVLGIRAGTVRRIVIHPRQQMYAEAVIDDQARTFIRRDSTAVIRRQFGVAGAGFVDISRGRGEPLDWDFAVIEATTERAPTENVGALIDQARQKIFPILEDTGRAMHALADITERIDRGEGNVGRLMVDESLARQAEAAVGQLQSLLAGVARVAVQAEGATADVRTMIRGGPGSGGKEGLQALLRRADETLANLQAVTRDLARAAQRAPVIATNVESGTANLPALLTQAQTTAQELELLLTQLRGLWLLGGSGPPPAELRRLPATEVRP